MIARPFAPMTYQAPPKFVEPSPLVWPGLMSAKKVWGGPRMSPGAVHPRDQAEQRCADNGAGVRLLVPTSGGQNCAQLSQRLDDFGP